MRQTGPIKVKESFKNGEDAFSEKRSVLFKQLHVSRFWDASHQSFVYVVWTARVINGSPVGKFLSGLMPASEIILHGMDFVLSAGIVAVLEIVRRGLK